jgi:hypothetical protein
MKTLIIFLALTFSVMFSSSSYAGWTKIVEGASGNTSYVDFERIREHDGYVYFWELADYLKPTSTGVLSGKVYSQGDCKLFRSKILSYSFHNEPMGNGIPADANNNLDGEWRYPAPNSVYENVLQSVCNR